MFWRATATVNQFPLGGTGDSSILSGESPPWEPPYLQLPSLAVEAEELRPAVGPQEEVLLSLYDGVHLPPHHRSPRVSGHPALDSG